MAYTYTLRHLPVSLVSLYACINPIIAVALGIAVLGEPFTPRMALAAALGVRRRGHRAPKGPVRRDPCGRAGRDSQCDAGGPAGARSAGSVA